MPELEHQTIRHKNLTAGDVVGALTIVGTTRGPTRTTEYWMCICLCGQYRTVSTKNLLNGAIRRSDWCRCLPQVVVESMPYSARTHYLAEAKATIANRIKARKEMRALARTKPLGKPQEKDKPDF